MIDPLEAVLWYLLERRTVVATTDLCAWDEQRAERIMAHARMYQDAPGLWIPTKATQGWSKRVWAQIGPDPAYVMGERLYRKNLRVQRAQKAKAV